MAGVLALATTLLVGLACSGCSSGGGDAGLPVIPPGITASFAPSGTTGAPNLVRLTGSAVGDLVTVDVRITGQTTSSELYAFVFDLVLSDATVASYVPGSARLGTALQLGAGEQAYVDAEQVGDRVTVAVTKLGAVAGNGIGATDAVVASFDFRVGRSGATSITIDGPLPSDDPAALDPQAADIPSVNFDAAASAIMGS